MKMKCIGLLICLNLMSNCIFFKESDLDPKSELSLLYTLFLLNRKYEWKWEYEYVSSPNSTITKIHHVSKLPNNYEIPSNVSQASSEYHYGSFIQNADDITRFYFDELGRYQIDTYDGNTITILSSAIIDVVDSNQNDVIFLFNNASNSSIATRSIGIQRITKRSFEPFQTTQQSRNTAYFNGYHYFLFTIYFNKELFIQNSLFKSIPTPIAIRTKDGETWETVILKELRFNFSISNPILPDMGQSFFHQNSLVIPAGKLVSGTITENYFFRLPLDDFKNYQFYTFTNRNPSLNRIDLNNIHSYQDQILYKEYNPGPDTWYRDNNFIQAGSTNITIPSPNALEATSSPIFLNNGILLSGNGSGNYSTIDSSFNTGIAAFNHASTSGSTNMILFGNDFRIFQLDPFPSPPATIRTASSTERIQSTPVNFLFSGSLFNATYTSTVTYNGSVFDESATYIDFLYDTNQVYLKVDHSSGTSDQLIPPNPIKSVATFTEAKCTISDPFNGGINSLSLGGGKCLCVKVPTLTDASSNTIDDPRIVVSKCIDSNNWTDWEEPKIYPIL